MSSVENIRQKSESPESLTYACPKFSVSDTGSRPAERTLHAHGAAPCVHTIHSLPQTGALTLLFCPNKYKPAAIRGESNTTAPSFLTRTPRYASTISFAARSVFKKSKSKTNSAKPIRSSSPSELRCIRANCDHLLL